jgi:hypothetical protein
MRPGAALVVCWAGAEESEEVAEAPAPTEPVAPAPAPVGAAVSPAAPPAAPEDCAAEPWPAGAPGITFAGAAAANPMKAERVLLPVAGLIVVSMCVHVGWLTKALTR